MNIKIYSISLLFIILFSCEKNQDIIETQEQSVSLEGNVFEQGYSPLDSVEVSCYYLGEQKIVYTDENGHYYLENLNFGQYFVKFKKFGYSEMFQNITIENDSQINTYTYSANTFMYRNDKTLSTKILYGQNSVLRPAMNKKYYVKLPDNFYENVIEGNTGSGGEIIVENLPDVLCKLEIEFKEDNYNYYLYDYYNKLKQKEG